MVDATPGFPRLSFMDAFSRYNHIPLYELDQVHTSFKTDNGLYCYIVMPFGLKNANVIYQKFMKKIDVYIDDMVTKTTSATSLTPNI